MHSTRFGNALPMKGWKDFDNPANPKWEEDLGRLHLVELTLEPDPNESHREAYLPPPTTTGS